MGISVAVSLVGVGILANVLVGGAAAAPTPTPTATATPTPSATATPTPTPTATATPTPSASAVAAAFASAAAPAVPAPTRRFNKKQAIAALDKVGKNLSECRRHNGLWGIGGATIEFGNDGAISKLTMGPPFRAAPEGTCVTERLMTAKIEPFAGPAQPVVYTFVVPLWPTPVPKK